MGEAIPRFRTDLEATPGMADGVSFVDVADPVSGRSFRFYDFEFALAQQLDGRPLTEVVVWMGETYGMELTVEGLSPFLTQLESLGFLASPSGPLRRREGRSSAGAARPPVPALPSLASVTSSALPPASMPLLGEADAAAVSELAFSAITAGDGEGHGEDGPRLEGGRMQVGLRALSDLLPAPFEAEPPEPDPEDASTVRARHPSATAPAADSMAASGAVAAAGEIVSPFPLARDAAAPSPPSLRETARPWTDVVSRDLEREHRPVARLPGEDHTAAPAPAPPAAPEDVPRPARQRRWPWAAGAAAITVVAGLAYLKQGEEPGPVVPSTAPLVHTTVPAPSTVYRWFDAQGIVVPGEDRALAFDQPGRVRDTLAPGTSFSAGQVLASLQGMGNAERDLNHARARLAAYEQLLETAQARGNQPQIRLAAAKVAEKKELLTAAEDVWRHLVIVADAAGEVGAVKAKPGDRILAGVPVVELRAHGPHAEWPLTPSEAQTAQALGFCRVESLPTATATARAAACTPASALNGKVFLAELPPEAGFAVGQPVRLARARYEGVFVLPRGALRETPLGPQVFVVSQPAAALRARTVRVAEVGTDDVLIAGGIGLGDVVVTQIEPSLKDGLAVRLAAP